MKKNDVTEKTEEAGQVERTIWTVRVGTQTLFRVHLDGRTTLDGMSQEEVEKVDDVLGKAIDEVAKILEKRTTQHKVAPPKEQITQVVEPTISESEQEADQEKEEKVDQKPAVATQTKVVRGPGGKFISKKASEDDGEKDENKDDDSSFFRKLIS